MQHINNLPINSGSGDTLHEAFNKVNDNFDELSAITVTKLDTSVYNAGYSQVLSAITTLQTTKVGEAPIDGLQYARQNAGWSVVAGGGTTFTGGTVTGPTRFIAGLSANTISATSITGTTGRFTNLSATTFTANTVTSPTISGTTGRFSNLSATTFSASSIIKAVGYSTLTGTSSQVLLADGGVSDFASIVSGGQVVVFEWKFQTTVGINNPGNGFWRASSAVGSATTTLSIADIASATGIDISALFTKVQGDWLIHIQQTNNASNFIQFSTNTAYIDRTGWWEVPVTYVQGNGFPFNNGQACTFVFVNQNNISTVVPTGTTININGVVQNLSTNREWRVAQADTGVLAFAGLSANTTTTIKIPALSGYVVDNETNPAIPNFIYVTYSGNSNVSIPTLGSGTSTYVLINSAGVPVFQNTLPTSAQRKSMMWLGKVGHPSGTITTVLSEPDYITSPLAFSRDLFQALGPYLNDGVYPIYNGSNLNINISAGQIHGDGINFNNDRTNPNEVNMGPGIAQSFLYRTQTGGTFTATTAIEPGFYDVAGTRTAVGGGSNSSTIQWIFAVPSAGFIIQYGQTVYPTLIDAVINVGRETFNVFPNLEGNAILIGVLVLNKTATNLSDSNQARFFRADKLGQIVGAQAGISTTTLQAAYNNSLQPQIQTSALLGAFQIKGFDGGSQNLFQGLNSGGTVTFNVNESGGVTANTLNLGSVIAGTSINNLGVDATGRVVIGSAGSSSGSTTFTGGTISGATNFTNGLSANTFSGTTARMVGLTSTTLNIGSVVAGTSINNLGIDSSGRVIIGSAGGSGTFTGGTVSGPTTFTAGLTATTSTPIILGAGVTGTESGTTYVDRLSIKTPTPLAPAAGQWLSRIADGRIGVSNVVTNVIYDETTGISQLIDVGTQIGTFSNKAYRANINGSTISPIYDNTGGAINIVTPSTGEYRILGGFYPSIFPIITVNPWDGSSAPVKVAYDYSSYPSYVTMYTYDNADNPTNITGSIKIEI